MMPKYRLYSLCALLIIALLAGSLLPAAALAAPPAQDGALDPAVLNAIQTASAQVVAAVGVGGAPADVSEVVATEEPPVDATTPVTATDFVTPTAFVVPTEADFDEFTNSGVSILAPRQWNVTTDSPDTIFEMSDDASGLALKMQDFGEQFPGLVIFPIFESNATELVQSFAENGVVSDVTHIELEQGVPALRIEFSGQSSSGEQKGGVIYLYATGSSALALLGGASIDNWPELAPAIDEVATSVLFDDDKIDLQKAGADGIEIADPQGTYTLTAPAGWYASALSGEDLSVIIADPEIKVVGAMAVVTDTTGSEAEVQILSDAIAGALSRDDAQKFADEFVTMMDLGADTMQIDSAQTAVLPAVGDAAGIIRIVGTAPIEDGPMMDMSMYVAVYSDRVGAMVFFGTPADVQAQEESIAQILGSLKFP